MAARKKGLSLDEKRAKMLEIFYESKEFFQLKELEKIAPKQKGVISQSVKEVTQSLVDDGLVECEKIGTFVCYWAFPSKALQLRKQKLEALQTKLAELQEKVEQGRLQLSEAKSGKEETDERTNLLQEVASLRSKDAELTKKLDIYAEFDPAVIAKVKERTSETVLAANRWTDNIFAVKKWCKVKFGMDEKKLNKQFEIPEELDYVDE